MGGSSALLTPLTFSATCLLLLVILFNEVCESAELCEECAETEVCVLLTCISCPLAPCDELWKNAMSVIEFHQYSKYLAAYTPPYINVLFCSDFHWKE